MWRQGRGWAESLTNRAQVGAGAWAHAGADGALGLGDPNRGAALAVEIEVMGRRTLRLPMDVTRLDQVRAAVAATVQSFGRLDILVNNAGLGPSNLAENVLEEDFDYTLAVNLKGTFFASQAAGQVMIKQRYGRIVNIGSQAAAGAVPGGAGYSRTKPAVPPPTRAPPVPAGPPASTPSAAAPPPG